MRLADHVVENCALVQDRGLQPGQSCPPNGNWPRSWGVAHLGARSHQKLTSQGVLGPARRRHLCAADPQARRVAAKEAMVPLAGLIESDPHYRYDVLETRHALETSTAWLAAQRATAQDKAHIQRCFLK